MRLAAVSIRGFKSFADAVSFKVDGSLIGVVGPKRLRQVQHCRRHSLGVGRVARLVFARGEFARCVV